MKIIPVLTLCCLLGACQTTPTELPVVAPDTKTVGEQISPEHRIRKDPILRADYVRDVLGEPTVKRRENPTEVWVYAQSSCVLFIYMNKQSEEEKLVKHMEIGYPSFNATEKNSTDCLRQAAKLK